MTHDDDVDGGDDYDGGHDVDDGDGDGDGDGVKDQKDGGRRQVAVKSKLFWCFPLTEEGHLEHYGDIFDDKAKTFFSLSTFLQTQCTRFIWFQGGCNAIFDNKTEKHCILTSLCVTE